MRYKHTDGCDPDFITLCHELDAFLDEAAGGRENRAQYIPYNLLNDIHDVVVAMDEDIPAGCGSFKHYENGVAEVKRVFVRGEYRGGGIAKQIMTLLEQRAKQKGYRKLILETGAPLTAAMALYQNTGYRAVPNFGPYEGMAESVCMEKKI